MRNDSKGRPDVCREIYTPVTEDARHLMAEVKLQCNYTIAMLQGLFVINESHEVRRLLAWAMSNIEDAALHAVKAITAEGFVTPGEQKPKDWGPGL